MKRIALLSDTHGYWDERYVRYMSECDEIWHAGDIGTMSVADALERIAPLRAVCGNVDGGDLRYRFPLQLRWKCEELDIFMKHIGGYPGHYASGVDRQLMNRPPGMFISGHSHILRVMWDPTYHLLHVNPGAAGIQGWHQVRTLVRFTIDCAEVKDMEIVELH